MDVIYSQSYYSFYWN